MRKIEGLKRLLSFLLAFSMVLSYVPMPGLAEEVCTHHTHDETCGYSEGAACGFDHAANCRYETVVVNCTHIHGEGGCTYVAAKEAVNCHPEHTESCGYVPAVNCTCGVTEGEHLEGCAYQEEGSCNVTHLGCACAEAVPESGECNHSCSAETGCEVTENHICVHAVCDETCGFKAAADCTFVCGECNAEKETEPQPEPAVLTVTAWSWVDDYEIIDTDYMDAVIPGVGAENPIDWETLVELLPAHITAQVNGEEVELPVTWECEDFPESATGGRYTLKAVLPEGYVLDEGVAALELEVDLGTVQQLYNLQGDGSASNPYLIYNSEDLHEFAWRVNNNGSSADDNKRQSSACAKLMNSIAYNYDKDSNGADAWYAIGSKEHQYTGTFDGQGYTISGLSLTGTDGQNSFIRYLGAGGTIKNLTINGTFSGSSNIGGIAGQNYGTISNCTFNGAVTGTGYNAGSIVGKNFGTITGCRNNGTVSGNENTGGIVGLNESGGSVDQCINNGSVSGTQCVGGIAGTNNSTIKNCHNAKAVAGSSGKTGGIVGVNVGTVTGCLNTASVTCPQSSRGGLAGETKSGSILRNSCFSTSACDANTVGTEASNTKQNTGKYSDSYFQNHKTEVIKLLNGGESGVWSEGTTYPVLDGGSSPNPGIITITGQPNTTILTYNEYGPATFGVLAKVSNSSALTYQWYRCDDSEKTNAQPVEGGTGKYFTIPLGLEPGKYYYYCTVSAEGAESVDTDVVYAHVKVPHKIILTASEGGSVIAVKFNGNTPLESSVSGIQIFLKPTADEGYEFKEWKIISGGVSINSGNNSFYMPDTDVKIEAVFEKVPTTCRISIDDTIANGTVTADKTDALENESITLTVTPNEGYKLASLTVDSTDVTTKVENNRYTFPMPAKDVTVSATFQVIKYPVKVQNVEVTALNKSDVLKDGTVSYDPATFTLSLNNADISYGSGAAIHSTYPDYTLKIEGTGTNTISSTGGSGIYVNNQDISIRGGTFLISGSTNGIVAEKGTLTVDGAQVKAVGTDKGVYAKNGITVINGGGLLAVTGNAAVVRGNYTMGDETFDQLTVMAGAVLNIESGKTVVVKNRIDSSGAIRIEGVLKVPEGSGRNTMSGGILYIGEKGYAWDETAGQYYCLNHEWEYNGDKDTIIATCNARGCSYTGSATLTIVKPALTVYGGSESSKATLVASDASVFNVTELAGQIWYAEEDTVLSTAPTGVGSYTANIQIDQAKATVAYSVNKAIPTITKVSTIGAITYGQTLADATLTGGAASVEGTFAFKDSDTAPAVADSNSTEYTLVFTPTNADNYDPVETKVKVTVNPKEIGITWDDTEFTYDGEAKLPAASITEGSAINGDQLGLTVALVETTEGAGINAGTYTAKVTAITGQMAGNYKLPESVAASFEIKNASQNKPENLSGNKETVLNKADGTITGLTTAMEISTAENGTYAAVADVDMTFAAGTYYVRYAAKTNYDASPAAAVTIAEGDPLSISVPGKQTAYSLTADKTEAAWHDAVIITFTLKDGYSAGDDFAVKVNGTPVTLAEGQYTIQNVEADVVVTVEGIADTTAPTLVITLEDNWNSLWNGITFGKFFKETKTFTISAADQGTGLKNVSYYLASEELEDVTTATVTWTEYDLNCSGVSVDPDKVFVIYAKAEDNAGNITYVNSNGIVLDKTVPVITGVTNGSVYYTTQKVTANDTYLDTLKLNGTEFNGTISGDPAEETKYTVVAADKAGNTTTLEITMKPISSLAAGLPTEETVKLTDKEAIETIKENVSAVLAAQSANATQAETDKLHAILNQCNTLLNRIKQAEKVIALINAMPDVSKVKPDDKAAIDAYEAAAAAYNDPNLPASSKRMVGEENKAKLDAMLKALTAYDIIKQNSRSYVKGSGKKVIFTANGYYGKFTGIEVDGKTVESRRYTVESGSTIITLKSGYLETLSTGKHTIKVNYTDGSTDGKDTFRITVNNGNPFTGDDSHMMLFSAIMITSLLCMAMMVMFIPHKKGKYER